MYYIALLYEGLGQQLVRLEANSEADFFAKLDAQFGCYVCLWYSQEQVVTNEESTIPGAV
ncbi:hypothetical protein GCM10011338_37940 [Alteromonas lipolytica]|nr:hypothetical protein GCM10011338_37940 [Alteromonas lipolytica]